MARQLRCKMCGYGEFRIQRLVPTNTQKSTKGWKGEKAKGDGYHAEAVARMFPRKICKRCGTKHRMR